MPRNTARHTLAPLLLHFCVNCFISDFLSGPLHIGLVFHENLSYPRGVLRGIKQIVSRRPADNVFWISRGKRHHGYRLI